MADAADRILVLGYGNPGRLDDGLGPACARAIATLGLEHVVADEDYQLQPEDALRVAEAAIVVFVDAAIEGPEPFSFARVESRPDASFTTHELSPGALLALAESTLGARPEAYLVGIRGHEFDAFGERLSPRARENLAATVAFLEPRLRAGRFDVTESGHG